MDILSEINFMMMMMIPRNKQVYARAGKLMR